MTLQYGRVEQLVYASRANPALVVIQNNGAAGTPNLFVGGDKNTLQLTGLEIAPGGASPQLTVTEPLYGEIDNTGGTTQTVIVNRQG